MVKLKMSLAGRWYYDLTPMQQQQQKELRDELKRRRAAGENVRIKNGKVVHTDNQDFH